jgi:hypothetical protein
LEARIIPWPGRLVQSLVKTGPQIVPSHDKYFYWNRGKIKEDREDGLQQTPSAAPTLRDGTFQARAVAGCVLIVLTALLIAVSPWTEYYWHFDNFLHGGEDFEFGLLATIMVFCLVLVLLQRSKQGVVFWFALWRWLSVLFQDPDPASPNLSFKSVMASDTVPFPDPISGVYDLPLRI